MTRKEEIDRAWRSYKVRSNYRYDEKSFKEAAEWADRTMLERMLKYLEVEHPTFFENFGEEICKAMEE